MLFGDLAAGFVLGCDAWWFAGEALHLHGGRTEGRAELHRLALGFVAGDGRNADAERRRLAQKDVRDRGLTVGMAQHRDHDSRTVLLHLDGLEPDVGRAGCEQSLLYVAVDLRVHVVDVRLDLEHLRDGLDALAHPQTQHVRPAFRVAPASAVPDF